MKKGGLRRKPLADISNINSISKKEQKIKLSAATEELFDEEDIEYEIDGHNREECIKVKQQEMEMKRDYILKCMFSHLGCSKELPSVERLDSPARSPRWPFEMIPEVPNSPPESPYDYQYWEDDSKYWKDSPKLAKQ